MQDRFNRTLSNIFSRVYEDIVANELSQSTMSLAATSSNAINLCLRKWESRKLVIALGYLSPSSS